MKTLGELLSTARTAKGLSIEDIASITKIEPKHILSLENNDYASLPPSTFTKGFIRNYAHAVGKNADELVAIYRRDSTEKPSQSPPPGATMNFSLKKSLLNASKSSIALALLGITIFVSYLTFQYRSIIVAPPLTITQPTNSTVLTSPITIEGKTSPDSLITINSDTRIKPDQSGIFVTQLNLSPGDYQLTISATNRYNRTSTKNFNISIISQ